MSKYKEYELLPCPHCGGTARLEASQRGFSAGQPAKVTYVRCADCNARGPRFVLQDFGKTSHSRQATELAVNGWNMRR